MQDNPYLKRGTLFTCPVDATVRTVIKDFPTGSKPIIEVDRECNVVSECPQTNCPLKNY